MKRSPLPALALAAVVSLVALGVILRGEEPLIQIDDARIERSEGGWTISNSLLRYSLSALPGGGFGDLGIEDMTSGLDWHHASAPDSSIRVNGGVVAVGGPATPITSAEVVEWWGGVRLDVHYRLTSPNLDLTRSYVCYPASSVIETWTTVHSNGSRSVTLSDLGSYELAVANGTLHWITGLQTPDELGGQFTRAFGDLEDGQVVHLGSDRRASETSLPWFALESEGRQFFGSILWSGSWHLRLERRGDDMLVRLGLPSFATTLAAGATLELPHAIFGLTNAVVPEVPLALRGFIERGVRHGRPLGSHLTANTWYAYGTLINEPSVLAEMEMAAAAGMEQFVVDAGWWADLNWDTASDFVHGWGNWQIDYDRFPNGLGGLSDRAHQLGMRFGVWVEPERVDRGVIGQIGQAQERFLATDGGRYMPPLPNNESDSGQVCLADPEARTWVLTKLTNFIDEVHPDYLKWDNNVWLNCTRTSHGHGSGDGNFQHHRGLQTILDELREIYPTLDIENCAGGGNRLSLDMLARTEAAWVDDQTGLSARTRHSLEGLMAFLPAPWLLSFSTAAIEGIGEDHTGDAAYVMRSRMLGMPGTSWQMAGMDGEAQSGVAREAALYRRIRPIQSHGAALLLSPQVPNAGWPGWDAVEYLAPGARDAVVMAFSNYDSPTRTTVRLRGLLPDAVYAVESADAGDLGTATGDALMRDGVELELNDQSLGHVLLLRAE